MSQHEHPQNAHESCAELDHSRTCDRCDRPRPSDPERFTVTASDRTDATADYERALLCADCYRRIVDDLRRCLA